MALSYKQFRQVGREQWLVPPGLLRSLFVRVFGPLGVHARIRNTRVINAINRPELSANAHILDAGCGKAYATLWLARRHPDYQFTALELDSQLVENGRRITRRLGLGNVEFVDEGITEELSQRFSFPTPYLFFWPSWAQSRIKMTAIHHCCWQALSL